MKITALVENISENKLTPAHGLSLYIETDKHRMLFDLGPDFSLLKSNAEKLGVDIQSVDTVIISHGHNDHGGALKEFLDYNKKAVIYIQKSAFEPHFSMHPDGLADIGLDTSVMDDSRIKLIEGDYRIDSELFLFTVKEHSRFLSTANNTIFSGKNVDSFVHEQNLIIYGSKNLLITGCSHKGIVNILDESPVKNPDYCIGGFHLCTPSTGEPISAELLDSITDELSLSCNTQYFTCHCTGLKAFEYISGRMNNIDYLHCGDTIAIS